ncbi:ABC transporter ATP-binding protein [Mycolicibacterium flavescens]|uniref:Multidrug ABC transporter ATP-binding protein n=1 Tax=Mycolicibacterium flavescens TaxID=1776 RepID=A0A1E3RRA3_MYCFV|nr:ABC transporter ATP-binding protein [Mycolicibacterium flavescens]MCV7279808.1 ABC transporter ATP-binding protein [Mycolicibacterium flavescens]ODQ92436.1 multidrug ABC transporter ATP-binding protein [Mycolicibacterium flavescens]
MTIDAVGVTKSFGRRRAVDGVTVSFPAGAVTALLGLNGAGKTTLLRILGGLTRPDTGTVTVCGTPAGADPLLSGFHLGPAAMNPGHTVHRHLRWLAALSGIGDARIDEVLAETGLNDHRAQRIAGLSLGLRQRVAVAGTLLADPPTVLFDEPLNGLDVPGIVWFRSLVRELADRGRTVVVATHLLGEVALTADHIVLLRDGRVHATGDLGQLTPAGADTREWLESTLLECA